jgi:hypothetical protein
MRYAHVLPALMVANFMKEVQNDSMNTTVLCQGYGIALEEEWWSEQKPENASAVAVRCVPLCG